MLRLRELRLEKGISLDKLGEIFHVQKSTLSRMENGKQEPKADFLNDLADYFGVTVDYLLGRTNEKTFTIKDQASVKKDLKEIMNDFKNGEAGPIFYNGHELSENDLNILEAGMEVILTTLKAQNKEKYTPKSLKKY